MVDLGPLEPCPNPGYIPKTVVEALELWHAAWERDHPELLGPLGPSFYRPRLAPLLDKAATLPPPRPPMHLIEGWLTSIEE